MSNDKQFIDFKKEVEKLKEIDGAEEYVKQLAHLFFGNGLSLQTILLMAIDFGQQHPHWIPVEERLPEVDQKVWIFTADGKAGIARYDKHGFNVSALLLQVNVTHWMEIVPPRKEE